MIDVYAGTMKLEINTITIVYQNISYHIIRIYIYLRYLHLSNLYFNNNYNIVYRINDD